MDAITTGFGVLVAVVLLVVIVLLFMVSRLFRKVEQGKALIISKIRKVDVTFTGAVVLPVFNKAEIMDISVKTIDIERTGNEGLICRDNIRADIRITFFVRVNKTTEDVIKVAQAIGTARASDQETLQELFNAKFSEALKTVGKQLDFVGSVCVIRTGRVSQTFGQAEVTAADGSSAIIQVRQTGTDTFKSGTAALIYEYDADGEFFWVTPVPHPEPHG